MNYLLRSCLPAAFAGVLLLGLLPEVCAINSHPCLYTTPAGVELARNRVRDEQWARAALEELTKRAEKLAAEPLPAFEKDWWKSASQKPWQQIYPEINEHTNFAVSGPAYRAFDAARVYAITGDARWAELVRRVLTHYCDYEFFAKHPDVGLNWSVWVTPMLMAYDLVHDTVADDDRTRIDDFFTRAMNAVMDDDTWWIENNPGGLFNNHFAWHKYLIGSYGLFYGRDDLVNYAFESDQGVRDLLEHGARDEGLWFESSLNYHFTAVTALVAFAGQLANCGHPTDLWRQRFANGVSLENFFVAPIATLFPDRTIPTIGDAYGRRMKLGGNDIYYSAYNAYGRPELAWLLEDRAETPPDALFLRNLPRDPQAPEMSTRTWPEHGYIALRSQEGADYWRGEGYSAFVSFDLDSIHSHRDKFDLMVFGRGRHLAVDPEALSTVKHAFSAQVQAELNRSTICHNTVMVDGIEQRAIGERLYVEQFRREPTVKMATISDRRGLVYAGVRQMRTVAVTDDFVLDVFQLSSDQPRTYDYLFHSYDDRGSFEAAGDMRPVDLPDTAAMRWLRNARGKTVAGDWHVTARQGDLKMRLQMAADPGGELLTCEFPFSDDHSGTPYPMLIARRKAAATVFVALLQAERGELPEARVAVGREKHGYIRITVESRGKSQEFSIPEL